MTTRASGVRLFLTVFAGVLLVQAAWCLVVPPFRGMDEHDHAFKAAAVAGGDWATDHEPSSQGWGDFVVVPRALVTAARPICETLPYTTPDNCTPGADQGDGRVQVASSAASYNPAYYAVVGALASPFTGVGFLYGLRAAGALLCAALIALSFVTTGWWARSRWPFIGLLLAATPVLLNATAMAAPNGLELSAAMLVWSAVLGLAVSPDPALRTRLVMMATVGAVPLALVRTLGPLWLALILVVTVVLVPRDRLGAILRTPALRWSAAAVTASVVAAATWTLTAGTNQPSGLPTRFPDNPWAKIPGQWALWFLQSVAAFPARDELSPMYLYVIAFVAWWVLLALFWKGAARRERLAGLAVVALASAVPIVLTVATYAELGTAWQGRYSLPFSMGLALICGAGLDRRPPGGERVGRFALCATAFVYVLIEGIAQRAVLAKQLRTSPLSGDSEWLTAPVGVVLALIVLGGGLQLLGVLGHPLVPQLPDDARQGAADPVDAATSLER